MLRRSLIALLLSLCGACAAPAAAPPPGVTLDFRGLWFSDDDVARMRSGDARVTPSEDVSLSTWNAITTDSPHPDIVNAQVRITVPDDAGRKATVVALQEEWRIGGREGEETAEWGERAQRSSAPVDLVPGHTVSVSLPIAVGDMVRRQIKAGRKLYRLAVRVELRGTPLAPVLGSAQATLPILTSP